MGKGMPSIIFSLKKYIFLYFLYWIHIKQWFDSSYLYKWYSQGVVANVRDCDLEVSKFEIYLHYYVHFWTNTLAGRMNPTKVDMPLNKEPKPKILS